MENIITNIIYHLSESTLRHKEKISYIYATLLKNFWASKGVNYEEKS